MKRSFAIATTIATIFCALIGICMSMVGAYVAFKIAADIHIWQEIPSQWTRWSAFAAFAGISILSLYLPAVSISIFLKGLKK
jgi:hypothetical protein